MEGRRGGGRWEGKLEEAGGWRREDGGRAGDDDLGAAMGVGGEAPVGCADGGVVAGERRAQERAGEEEGGRLIPRGHGGPAALEAGALIVGKEGAAAAEEGVVIGGEVDASAVHEPDVGVVGVEVQGLASNEDGLHADRPPAEHGVAPRIVRWMTLSVRRVGVMQGVDAALGYVLEIYLPH